MAARTSNKPPREDALRNAAQVRNTTVAFIKKHHRPPSIQELVAATGLSDKTVKAHRKRLKLGDGSDNVFQQLSPDVLMKLFERATGYSHKAVKIFNDKVKGIVKADYTEHYPPDAMAAKLWFQLVEGFTEKSEKKHTGEVGLSLKFNYVAPASPQPEGGTDGN
jgi:hypothetical protein